ncbi:hypothetical protein SAMN05421757_111171 [Tropicimonas sediminicola]|uniref:Uncharacterized protein n=1 Tax=Tropicimonas sediminicola TaxID=1031541 RepID=A0A239M0L2_9RHOB|nr:hypothetical protein SAMN05421757_111171 [Tropicimonas sediminicola]
MDMMNAPKLLAENPLAGLAPDTTALFPNGGTARPDRSGAAPYFSSLGPGEPGC